MEYSETLPDNILSNHIESYWQIKSNNLGNEGLELLLPTCTFNIIFSNKACLVKSKVSKDWKIQSKGATFFGQTNNSVVIKSKDPIHLYGIRFKPFAFSKISHQPAYILNDDFVSLDNLYPLAKKMENRIREIVSRIGKHEIYYLIDELMFDFFKDELSVDEKLRAQLNFIMDRRGSIKINEVFRTFGISKVTLRKHFINKVGLTPKKVSQIWRMNYMLQLKSEKPKRKLTSLCLQAGFYDQAHFIKDFKQLFHLPPAKFFSEKSQIIELAQHNISRRFSNQYDPK